MNRFISQLAVKIGISSLWLRIVACILAAVSGILVYISRKEPELPMTRVYIPNLQTRVTYIWQLLVVAGFLVLTAIAAFVMSFQKKKV
jgi:hypothetical protein